MKAILYIGVILMIAATIYGFVDHKKAGSKNEFQEMYNSKESSRDNKSETALPAKSNVALPEGKKSDELEEVKVLPEDKAKETAEKPAKSKRKKIDPELFSRAPLKEQEPAKVKTSSKKTRDLVIEEKQ
jgi:hypothetical protein